MASTLHLPVTAAQVGAYFAGQYYLVLQQQPDYVHQFYSDVSTLVRVDGNSRETGTGFMQIHNLIMSVKFTGIEMKTVQSLESWSGGVIVVVTGSVEIKSGRKKFSQTFFLAPQEKGYFVLNDIFHFIDDDPVKQPAVTLLPQSNFDSKLNAIITSTEKAENNTGSGEMHGEGPMARVYNDEGSSVSTFSVPERENLHKIGRSDQTHDDDYPEEANNVKKKTHLIGPLPFSAEETSTEPQKHTYASILRVVKGPTSPAPASQPNSYKSAPPISAMKTTPQDISQHASNGILSDPNENEEESAEESGRAEDGDVKSVYVRNLPPTVSASEIEEQFKTFGQLKPDSVVIRGRKDVGVCYAFVEFEDINSVQNAIKASTVFVSGRPAYIEERRGSTAPRGRRGRGQGGYRNGSIKGRYGNIDYVRESMENGGERDYNRPNTSNMARPRGNGFYRQANQHDKAIAEANPEHRNASRVHNHREQLRKFID